MFFVLLLLAHWIYMAFQSFLHSTYLLQQKSVIYSAYCWSLLYICSVLMCVHFQCACSFFPRLPVCMYVNVHLFVCLLSLCTSMCLLMSLYVCVVVMFDTSIRSVSRVMNMWDWTLFAKSCTTTVASTSCVKASNSVEPAPCVYYLPGPCWPYAIFDS